MAGSGTYFLNRDRLLPSGARRWWRGKTFSSLALDVTRRFDGTNETDVKTWFRDTYCTWLTPQTGNFLAGLLSEAENTTIAAGLTDVVMDHFADVVDRNGSTDLVFRSGSVKAIQPGSWIVNCTGYFKSDDRPYQPYISRSGAVLSIQPRSVTLQLTSMMAYFMTHLLMLGKIRDIPLYELDAMDLRHKSNAAFTFTLFTLTRHNISLIFECVPTQVFSDCGIDPDRWYPTATAHGGHGTVHAHAPSRSRTSTPSPRHRAGPVRRPVRPADSGSSLRAGGGGQRCRLVS